MDVTLIHSTEHPSAIRQILLRAALGAAIFLVGAFLIDCLIDHPIVRCLIASEWYVLFGFWWLFSFLLAVLLGELRDMVLPTSRAWSNSEHVDFVVIFCIFGFFVMPMVYLVAMFVMIHNYGAP